MVIYALFDTVYCIILTPFTIFNNFMYYLLSIIGEYIIIIATFGICCTCMTDDCMRCCIEYNSGSSFIQQHLLDKPGVG